ncbi:AraC family transcriptional regulator, partial [bacterium]|nr:AraC family transcriptional regulator [bacterium]
MKNEVMTTALGIYTLYKHILSLGVSEQQIEKFSGICPIHLINPDRGIPLRQFLKLWEMGIEISGNPALAIHLTQLHSQKMMHFVVHLAISSDNMLSAYNHWSNYAKFVCKVDRIDIRNENDHIIIRYVNTSPEHQNIWIPEHYLSLALEYGRIFTEKDFNPLEVRFQHPAPADLKPYQSFFRSPILFDQKESAMVFHKGMPDLKLTTHNPSLQAILKKHAEASLGNVSETDPFQAKVRELIVKLLPEGGLCIEAVSDAMNLGRSTLHRRLKQEGTTYTDVLEQVRKDLSQHYLRQGFSCNQIANLLGFSESSTFNHAYKRWFGRSPKVTLTNPNDM